MYVWCHSRTSTITITTVFLFHPHRTYTYWLSVSFVVYTTLVSQKKKTKTTDTNTRSSRKIIVYYFISNVQVNIPCWAQEAGQTISKPLSSPAHIIIVVFMLFSSSFISCRFVSSNKRKGFWWVSLCEWFSECTTKIQVFLVQYNSDNWIYTVKHYNKVKYNTKKKTDIFRTQKHQQRPT